MGKIVALGGGGVGGDRFERETVRLSGKKSPSVLMISYSKHDDTKCYEALQEMYGVPFGSRVERLTNKDGRTGDAVNKIAAADIIYVCGGDTRKLMRALWRYDLYEPLAAAYRENKKVLCGASAGAICWCAYGCSDFKGEGILAQIRGLGFLGCMYTPHTMTDAARFSSTKKMLRRLHGVCAVGMDNAALVVDGDRFTVLAAEVYRAELSYWDGDNYHVEPLVADVWRPLDDLKPICE